MNPHKCRKIPHMEATRSYSGAQGTNYYATDKRLQALLRRLLPKNGARKTMEKLESFGELCGGRLSRLIDSAHREGNLPRLTRYDRWGKRIDVVEYCPEQLEARRLALEAGVLPPTPLVERMAMDYMLNQNGEGGITCPLAMTDGLIELLDRHGSPGQKTRWLKLLSDPDGPTPLTAGQYVTERQGGSNVSENETAADLQEDGSWRLTGLKWFCSNPGELWVTTAKPRGSERVALFLVPRRLPDGSLNECHILRLKDLVGTRGKATAEVEYKAAHAELIGRTSHGMAILLQTVLKTSRIHTANASVAFMRRAFVEASLYASDRVLLGRPINTLPPVADSLLAQEARLAACQLAFFREIQALEELDPAADVLVPLLKTSISREGTRAVREAQLILGGNGILRDFSILPRLADDAFIQEIWEGTHSILASHALKALLRPRSGAAFLALLNSKDSRLKELRVGLEKKLTEMRQAGEEERLRQGSKICEMAFSALGHALLLEGSGTELDTGTPLKKLKNYW